MRAILLSAIAAVTLSAWCEIANAAVERPADAAAARVSIQPLQQQVAATHHKRKVTAAKPDAAPTPPVSKWNGADPTKGPGIDELHRLQREGQCVIDEGYGRYSACSNR